MPSPIISRRECDPSEVFTSSPSNSSVSEQKSSPLSSPISSPTIAVVVKRTDSVGHKSPSSPRSLQPTKISTIKIQSERSLFSSPRRRLRPVSRKYKLCKSSPELNAEIVYHDAISSIKIVDHIGCGSYSAVYKGERLDGSGEIIAVKIIKKSDDTDSDNKNFEAEENAFSRLNGQPGIIEYIGIVKERAFSIDFFDNTLDWVGFCMKYYKNGDIHRYMSLGNKLQNDMAHSWIIDVITGLSTLHNLDPILLHRDVKSPNFLIDDDFSLKLTDFGLARYDNDANRSGTFRVLRTSMLYSPPELFSEDEIIYRPSSDIYALTIVIWEIISYVLIGKYKPPFDVSTPWQLPKMIVSGKRPEIDRDSFGKEWVTLLESGWNQDISKRPSLLEMMTICKNLTIPLIPSAITCTNGDDNT